MKVVPIARKARELARGREVQTPRGKHPFRWVMLGVVFVLTVLLVSPSIWLDQPPTVAGAEIEGPIVAQVAFSYSPTGALRAWEARRDREHRRVFIYDSSVQDRGMERLERILQAAQSAPPHVLGNDESLSNYFAERDPQLGNWPAAELRMLASLARDERFRNRAALVLGELYGDDFLITTPDWSHYSSIKEQFREVQYTSLPPGIEPRVRRFPEDAEVLLRNLIPKRMGTLLENAMGDEAPAETGTDSFAVLDSLPGQVTLRLLNMAVRPNLRFSKDETRRRWESFPRDRPREIAKETPLIAEESGPFPREITEEEADLLRAYAVPYGKYRALRFGAEVLFVLIALLIISFFVIKFSHELTFSTPAVLLLSLPLLLALGLGRLFLLIAGDASPLAGYAFPAGVIGILGVLMLDVRMALMLVTLGCLLFGVEANLEYEFVIVGLFGGYTAVAALYTFRERREVLYAGLLIGFVNAATILILHAIGGNLQAAWTGAAIGAFSGIMCSLISFAVLPVFEVLFQITTDMRLLELCGLQHPLLRRMEEEAPGTLQHTLNVAKLAESAATAIGVNYLLVRAGCYYHDVGKMSKPEYFTENQITPEDRKRHDDLRPQMSTLIIRNHVKEGLELAKRHKLPPVVADFIAEHHGTSLIQYFYRKAQKAFEKGEMKEPVREDDYRYPGPKPQTIESAIVMLADTVEATATAKLSARAVREDDIELIVRNAITEKFNDGQFDNCNLTLRDLNIIRESFVKTLRSRFHTRIDYPDKKSEPQQRRDSKSSPKVPTESGMGNTTREEVEKMTARMG
ncbi:MAG: cyclic-di-AMP phosphodiesterase PgpH [Candidatus Sumerlaeota bacterium]|nr:cyclic-di-AMP phosphodiesterase PgpH [Candidatus Sumerlaeota bacterium]